MLAAQAQYGALSTLGPGIRRGCKLLGSSRHSIVFVALTLLLLAVAGCGDDDSDESTATTSQSATTDSSTAQTAEAELTAPDSVSLQICGGQSANAAAYWAAEGAGLYDEIEQRFSTQIALDTAFAGPSECQAAFLGGQNDFTSTAFTQVLQMAGAGQDVVTVMDLHNGGGTVLVGAASQEAERGTELENLAGATIGVSGPGSLSEFLLTAILESEGIDVSSVTFLPLGGTPALPPALEAGQIDAASLGTAQANQVIAAGIGYEYLNLNDASVLRPLVGDLMGPFGMTTTSSFTGEYPALTQALVNATYEGLRLVQEADGDPDATLALFPQEIQAALGEGFGQTWALTYPAIADVDPAVTEKEANDTITFVRDYSGADVAEIPDSVVDNSFVIQAYGELGVIPPDEDLPVHPDVG